MQILKKNYCVLEIFCRTLEISLILFAFVLLTQIEKRTCKYFFFSMVTL